MVVALRFLTVNTLSPLRLDRSRQASPQVFDHLRERIIHLDLVPGTVCVRAELAEAYGVSQTPIRDALLRLAGEGLVDIFPQHATRVSRIDIAAAQRDHFLRLAIESELAFRLATQRPDGLVERLRAQIAVMAALAGEDSRTGFIEADRSFHRQMYDAAGLSELYALVRQRSGHIDRLRMLHLPKPGKARQILRDHARIVDALAQSDGLQAQAAVRAHLSGTLAEVQQIAASHPDWVST